MQFENRLAGDPSSLTRTKHGDEKAILPQYPAAAARSALAGPSGALWPHARSYRQVRRPLAQHRLNGGDRAPRRLRAIAAAAAGFVTKAIVGFAACGEAAFPRLLFMVMSWTIAEVLAGCAAYAVAMHPCLLDSGESLDGRDPARDARSGQEDSGARLATWRALDHRPLKEVGISCADIEYLAGSGDRRE
jgi:hypothetical protein